MGFRANSIQWVVCQWNHIKKGSVHGLNADAHTGSFLLYRLIALIVVEFQEVYTAFSN